MQKQPRPHPSRVVETRRARQASLITDDTFKGGESPARRAGAMPRSPWLRGPGHLWDTAGRSDDPGQS